MSLTSERKKRVGGTEIERDRSVLAAYFRTTCEWQIVNDICKTEGSNKVLLGLGLKKLVS